MVGDTGVTNQTPGNGVVNVTGRGLWEALKVAAAHYVELVPAANTLEISPLLPAQLHRPLR